MVSSLRTAPLRYRAYGLTLGSDIPLPELLQSAPQSETELVDIHVSLGGRMPHPKPTSRFLSRRTASGKAWLAWAKTDQGYLLRFSNLAMFYLDQSGRTMVGTPRAGITKVTLRHLLLDQVLPLALTLHGQQALHATAVLTPAGVCAFVGPAGAGKSTLAASFQFAGIPAISDDCLVLEPEQGLVLARPAYPGVRLWDDSLTALCAAERMATLPVAQYTAKRRPVLAGHRDRFVTGRHSLARIYVLRRHKRPLSNARVEPLSQQAAFRELLGSSFILDSRNHACMLRQFEWLERIVSLIPVRRLHIPNRFEALSSVRNRILADL